MEAFNQIHKVLEVLPKYKSPSPGMGHWEKKDAPICDKCKPVEAMVSDILRREFQFRSVRIDDMAMRNKFEKVLISTISRCPICRPSPQWLGLWAYNENVRNK